jgi:hypothetical protein
MSRKEDSRRRLLGGDSGKVVALGVLSVWVSQFYKQCPIASSEDSKSTQDALFTLRAEPLDMFIVCSR